MTGFLAAADDIDEAVGAVGSSATSSRSRCREHAEDELDFELTLDAHEALYREVAGASIERIVSG